MSERLRLYAILFLGTFALLSMTGIVVVSLERKSIPAEIAGPCGVALGFLGGQLTPPRPEPSGAKGVPLED